MIQPKKPNNGLTPEDNKKLIEGMAQYANEGATDDELREFRDTFISAKKKSTPSNVSGSASKPQKSASVPADGSLATLGPKDPLAPVQTFTQTAKTQKPTTKTKPALPSSQLPEGSMAWTQARLLETDPEYGRDYERFKQAEILPEGREQQIRQEVEDEANNVGFINQYIKSPLRSFGNFLTQGTFSEGDALKDEKEQAKKELIQQNALFKKNKQPEIPITQQEITDRAKEIRINKRIQSERDSQVNSFLTDLENTTYGKGKPNARQRLEVFQVGNKSTLQEKDKQILKKQNVLRPAIESSYSILKDIQKDADNYVKNNQPIPEDLKQQHSIALEAYQNQLKDAIKLQEEYVSNKKDLGDAIENLDTFKRDFSWGKNFENNVLATTMDLAGGLVGFGDYINTVAPGLSPNSASNAAQFRSLSKRFSKEAQETRDEVMKPISVDDINSLEDFGKWMANTAVASQVPIYVAIATGVGGIGAIGASSTGQKFEEMQSEIQAGDADYSAAQLAGIPAAFGLTETASAMVDRMLLKNAARTIRSATAPERKLMADGFWAQVKNGATKIGGSAAKGAAYEGIDEVGTQFAQNVIDIYAGDKKDITPWHNIKDAGAAGTIMGFMIPFGANIVSKAVKPFSTDKSLQKASAELLTLENQLNNPELSPETREILNKQIKIAEEKQQSLLKKSVKNISSLTDEQFQEVVRIEKQQASLKEQRDLVKNNPELSDASKKITLDNLKDQFDKSEQRRLNILEGKTDDSNINVSDTGSDQDVSVSDDTADTTVPTVEETVTTETDETTQQATEQEAQPQAEEQAQVNEVDPRLKEINDKLDSLYDKLIKNGMNEADAERTALESLSPEERQILRDAPRKTTTNETTQVENTVSDGDVSTGTGELGAMGEETGATTGVVSEESTQPGNVVGEGEGVAEVDPRVQEIESQRQAELIELQNNPEAIEQDGEFYINGPDGVENSTALINEKYDAEIANLPAQETVVEDEAVSENLPEETALRNADIANKRNELGLEQRETVTRKSNEQLVEDAKKKIREGFDTETLIDDILDEKSDKTLTDEEVIILKQYQLAKENELVDVSEKIVDATREGKQSVLDKLIEQRESLINDIDKAYRAGEQSGTVTARALQARRIAMMQDYSLANMLIEKRKANNGEKLNNEQIQEVTDSYNAIKQLNDELSRKIEALEEENNRLKAQKTLSSLERAARKTNRNAKVDEINKSIEDTVASLKKKLQEQRGRLNSTPLPLELVPEIAKLAVLYTQKGVVNLADVVDNIYTTLKDDIEGLQKKDIEEIISSYDYEAESKQESRLQAFKKRTQKRIDEIADRIDRKDFAKQETVPVKLDKEAQELKDKLREAKFNWEKALEKDRLSKRSKGEKAGDLALDVLSVPRSVMASIDFSAPLRQGLVLTVNNPRIAGRAFIEMFRQAASKKRFDRWLDDLKNSEAYEVMKDSGLYIADQNKAKLSAKEEEFMSNLAEKIPGIGKGFDIPVNGRNLRVFGVNPTGGLNLIGGSERAYVSYLNKLRADVFMQTANEFIKEGKTPKTDPKLFKALGTYVNAATGRGDLGKFEDSAKVLSAAFFSPRLIASRLRLLTNWANPAWYRNTPPKIRRMYALDMVRTAGVITSLLALAGLAGADVEDDPRSSDWGKAKFGDTRLDFMGGFQPFIRYLSQLATGQTKDIKTGEIKDLTTGEFGKPTRASVIEKFIRSKMAPVPGTVWNLAEGRNMIGEEFGLKDVPASFLPLFAKDYYNAIEREGFTQGTLKTGLPGAFGVGTQTFESKDKEKNEKLPPELKKKLEEFNKKNKATD